jgi:hypothetical protein
MEQRLVGAAFILICSGLLGCATATTIIGPDGTTNQLISCAAVEQCYEKAREVCGGFYKIVNTSSETAGVNGTTSTQTKLLVKCGQ